MLAKAALRAFIGFCRTSHTVLIPTCMAATFTPHGHIVHKLGLFAHCSDKFCLLASRLHAGLLARSVKCPQSTTLSWNWNGGARYCYRPLQNSGLATVMMMMMMTMSLAVVFFKCVTDSLIRTYHNRAVHGEDVPCALCCSASSSLQRTSTRTYLLEKARIPLLVSIPVSGYPGHHGVIVATVETALRKHLSLHTRCFTRTTLP
eukprot:3132054-Amphidinium_carterae.2